MLTNRIRIGEFLWRLAIDPATFVVICLLWCLDLGAGSIRAYLADPDFPGKMDAYPFRIWLTQVAPQDHSAALWVYLLVVLTCLMVASLLLCSGNWLWRRRKSPRFLGEFLVHLGFLLIFAGFVTGAVWGERYQGIRVAVGGEQTVGNLGIALRLNNLKEQQGANGRTLDTLSELTLLEGGVPTATALVRLNHPLLRGSLVVYPRGALAVVTAVSFHVPRQGEVTLAESGLARIGSGTLRVERLLQEGERLGNTVGPAVLLQVAGPQGVSQQFLSAADEGRWLEVNGAQLALQGFTTTSWGNYDVHTDPGIRVVLVGAAILALGIVWALAGYLRQRAIRSA